jgi:nickel-dependent lactate racemase
MDPGSNFLINLTNKFRDASKQGGAVIIDGITQKGLTKDIAEKALKEVERKGVKNDTIYRIVGDGFEINKTIKAPKK